MLIRCVPATLIAVQVGQASSTLHQSRKNSTTSIRPRQTCNSLRASPLYETVVELAGLHDPVAVAVLRDSKTALELRAALLQAGETPSRTGV
jgi:hypothetical protein